MIARYTKLFLIALSLPALGEELCESKNLLESEEIVCSSMELTALHKKLNEVYAAAHRIDNDSQSLDRDQRYWLHDHRDKCDSDTCMYEVYENRIFFLGQKIEANKKLNEQPLGTAEYAGVCNEIANLAADKKLHNYKIVGIDAALIRNSIEKIWGSTADLERFGFGKGLQDVQEIYNIKTSNSSRARKFIKYLNRGTCASDKIYPIEYLTKSDKSFSGRVSVSDPDDNLSSVGWGASEFPIYYQQRNYIITGQISRPEMVSLIKPDGQILPLCLLTENTTRSAVADQNDSTKDLCAGVASGLIKPQLWNDAYTPDQVEKSKLIGMAEARGSYDINVFRQSINAKENKLPQALLKFMQDSGAGCGSHIEWLRSAVSDNNRLKIRFDDPLFSGKAAERIDMYLHNEKYYIGYFPDWGASHLYHLENDKLIQKCEFDEKLTFKVSRIF